MRAVRGLLALLGRPGRHSGVTSDRKDGPIGEMSDEEASLKRSKGNNSNQQGFEEEVDNECCICLVDIAELKFIGRMDCCEHVVCWFCIQEWSHKIRACPICQRPFRKCKKTKAKRKKVRPAIVLLSSPPPPLFFPVFLYVCFSCPPLSLSLLCSAAITTCD